MKRMIFVKQFVCGILLLFAIPFCNKAKASSASKPHRDPKGLTEAKDTITGWAFEGDVGGSYNNAGLRLRGQFGYKWRLFRHRSRAFNNNFVWLGAYADITPASGTPGAFLRIQPTSFFYVNVGYQHRFYFPVLTTGTPFKDISEIESRFSNIKHFYDGERRLYQQLDNLEKQNYERKFFGSHILHTTATLQLKFKGVVGIVQGTMFWYWMNHKDQQNSQYIYESSLDILIHKKDTVINIDALLGYEWKSVIFLVLNSYTKAFTSKQVRWALGPAVRWTIAPKWGPLLEPNLLFVVRWYIQHLWRIGPTPNPAILLGWKF